MIWILDVNLGANCYEGSDNTTIDSQKAPKGFVDIKVWRARITGVIQLDLNLDTENMTTGRSASEKEMKGKDVSHEVE